MKTTKTMLCGAIAALLGVSLIACGGGPAVAPGDTVSVPIFGMWEAHDDSGNDGTSTVTMTEVTEGGMPAWHFVGELTRDFIWGAVSFSMDLDERTMDLFNSADAISFMAKAGAGGQRYSVQILTRLVMDYGHFVVHFDTVEGEATRFTFPLRHFMQPAWAAPVGRLRADTITGMQWATHDSINPGPYEITIWDVRLYVPAGTEIPPDAPIQVVEYVGDADDADDAE